VSNTEQIEVKEVTWRSHGDALREIRQVVFVVEQNVPEDLEYDGIDPDCVHVLASLGEIPVGTGRLLKDGHIGRMAVLKPWRGKGVGGKILLHLMDIARKRGDLKVLLHAQTSALAFYQRYGFEPFGDLFMEADIEHRMMRRNLASSE
jgi:predicted GNAT family N-acyltransferase